MSKLHLVARGKQYSLYLSEDGNLILEDANCTIVADYPAPEEVLDAVLGPITEEVPIVRFS